jgi:hypothetical protein
LVSCEIEFSFWGLRFGILLGIWKLAATRGFWDLDFETLEFTWDLGFGTCRHARLSKT